MWLLLYYFRNTWPPSIILGIYKWFNLGKNYNSYLLLLLLFFSLPTRGSWKLQTHFKNISTNYSHTNMLFNVY